MGAGDKEVTVTRPIRAVGTALVLLLIGGSISTTAAADPTNETTLAEATLATNPTADELVAVITLPSGTQVTVGAALGEINRPTC